MDRYAFGCVFPMALIYGFCVVIIISNYKHAINTNHTITERYAHAIKRLDKNNEK
ncbi:hypothetical protein HpDR45_10140 [Helicobacter pylori]